MSLPQDPIILLSYVNTKLRDYYSTLDDLCNDLDCDKNKIITTLKSIDYSYNLKQNRFAPN